MKADIGPGQTDQTFHLILTSRKCYFLNILILALDPEKAL